MFDVDVSRFAAGLLSGSDDVECKGGLTGSFGPVDLNDTALGNAAYAESKVERKGTGGERFDVYGDVVAETHNGALAVVLLYLRNAGLKCFLLVRGLPVGGDRSFFLFCHLSTPHVYQYSFFHFPMTTRSVPRVSSLTSTETKPA